MGFFYKKKSDLKLWREMLSSLEVESGRQLIYASLPQGGMPLKIKLVIGFALLFVMGSLGVFFWSRIRVKNP